MNDKKREVIILDNWRRCGKGRILILTGILLVFVFSLLCSVDIYARNVTGMNAKGAESGPGGKEDKVAFNFVDVELPVLAKFVSDLTGKNFIFDDRFKGKITIIAPSKLSLSDAFTLFSSVLEFKGYTLVPSGVDAYKIVRSADAKMKGIDVVTGGSAEGESYVVRLVPLRHISSEEALTFLRPVISRDGHISMFRSGNILLIIDTSTNIEKVMKIIENIDRPSSLEAPEIVRLDYASAEEVARILNEGVKATKSISVTKPLAGARGYAVPDTRLNAVVLFGKKQVKEEMKRVINLLDIPSSGDQGRINVYFLENADAEDLAKVLEGVVKQTKAATGRKRTVTGRASVPFSSDSKIVITADKASNALIIVASPSDYKELLEVIRKLDRRRRQVYVEAMIVEASINRLLELGTKWRAVVTHNGEPVFITGVGVIDSTSILNIVSGLAGFTAGGMGNFFDIPVYTVNSDGSTTTTPLTIPGFAALFSLNQFRGAVNVLSTPQILTSDNEEAEIVVGENVPFITKRESDPSRTVSVFSSIERKDVGITLKITPQITEGDYVKLDIYQEISAVKEESSTAVLISVGPTTTKRSTSTSVVVKDNQTVVIGGLMQEKEGKTYEKVPLLGDIPILGWAFRSEKTTKEKTNLLVFLTPHIIRDDNSIKGITEKKRGLLRESMRVQKEETMLQNGMRDEGDYVPGQLLVRFKPYMTEDDVKELVEGHGGKVIKHIESLGIYLIEVRKDEPLKDAIEYYRGLQEVDYAEPNYRVRIQ